MLRLTVVTILFFYSLPSISLEIDEKLTMRILKVSTSKKTVLVNRGLEDGLVVGDHAKFFLTTGVVGRGVVVKASPSRSIWSVYRRVVPKRIIPDQVLNMKIATPVRLTPDKSRMIHPEPSFEPSTPTNIVLASGADDEDLTPEARRELEAVSDEEYDGERSVTFGRFASRSYEVFSEFGFSSETSAAEGDTTTSNTALSLTVGFEKYFPTITSFWKRFSVVALIDYGSRSYTYSSSVGAIATTTTEFGGGAHFHFLEDPSVFGRLIGYTGILAGLGKQSGQVGDSAEVISSSTNFITVPLGLKYYIRNGFGGRLSINYTSRTIATAYEEETTKYSSSGFVFHIGLQYRF